MTMVTGNTACTTGTSKRVYDELIAYVGNGFSGTLTTDQQNAIKAICYAVAKGVLDEIRANGVADPGGGNFAIE